MNKRDIIKAVESIKGGQFMRIAYRTEMPIRAIYKNKGCKIIKITEQTVRTGVNYRHINGVEPSNNMHNSKYEWICKNRILHHIEKDTDYVYVATVKYPCTKSKYIVIDEMSNAINMDELDDNTKMMLLKSSSYHPPVKQIKLENVLRIGHIGERVFA